MSSSVVASLLLPDASESGLFDAPQKPRQRNYRLLQGDHTCVIHDFAAPTPI